MVKFLMALLLLMGAASLSIAQSTNSTSTTMTVASNQSVSLSFVQTASLAQLSAIPGQPNQYRLILANVSPYITYFTERPGSVSGLALVPNFVNSWQVGANSFATNSPNAVIYAGQINGSINSSNEFYVVKLSSPMYSIQANEMSYIVTPLANQKFILSELSFQNMILVIN
ncbi:MAG: hypothetical protein A3E87_02550 [Gammaproteobacteria bacterium RIFCSPHIGHO2_12_FULL_35_23]|nr:MAG: hypothetical protein A3E87_02550 [Gammaproteobacteria bacterium RIFCSPHIGHO2_12_FULL_35_23]